MKLIISILCFCAFINLSLDAQTNSAIKLARVKYSGGGDWYNDPSSEENLLKFVKESANINVNPVYEFVGAFER